MTVQPEIHLLIVDDDERIRTLLQKYLIHNGFRVTSARDVGHARRLLQGLDFDLAVPSRGAPVGKPELRAFQERLEGLAQRAGNGPAGAADCQPMR